jgi:hypothetical protein
MVRAQRNLLYLVFALSLAVQIAVWLQVRDMKARWLNVPPVPGKLGAVAFSLGDQQFAYRTIGLTIQNFGDNGGQVTPIRDYNYDRLKGWFYLSESLDPRSDFVPFLAAYYFGASDRPEQLTAVADYLHDIGQSPQGEKWRWLAQAVYIQRYKLNDMDTAYKWSLELATMDNPAIAPWARQMPAFIKNAEGDKQAAYDIMVAMLKSGKGKMAREEVNAITEYICKRTLTPEKAKADALCATYQ